MKKSEDLFKLIKSLSKSEKRYFKIYTSLHKIGKENIYVRLFDVIDRMEEYNEDSVKSKFKGEKFISSLFSTKNYLFNIILKSLAAYYSESSPRSELSRNMDEALILFNKGLHEPCARLLKKAKAAASEYELFEMVLDILNLELRLAYRILYNVGADEQFEKIASEQTVYISKIKNYNRINYIYNHLLTIWRKDAVPTAGEQKWIEDNISNNPLFGDENNALSYKAKLFYLRTLYICHEMKFEIHNSYKYLNKIVELLDSHLPTLNTQSALYILSLDNIAMIEMYLKKYDKALKSINKLSHLPSRLRVSGNGPSIESLVFESTYNAYVTLCLQTGNYKKGIGYIHEALSGLKQFRRLIAPFRFFKFYYFFAYLYFMGNDFDNSLKWLNMVLNDRGKQAAPEIYSYANTLKLIIHYETKDYDLLESMINSRRRAISKDKGLYNFERLTIDFLAKALNADESDKKKELFKDLKTNLTALAADPYEKNALENLDLISWIESKSENKSLPEILKEKSLQPA